jgi:hypothetical protein
VFPQFFWVSMHGEYGSQQGRNQDVEQRWQVRKRWGKHAFGFLTKRL